ncbi:hypothetical protein D3C72_1324840 [compost metagenome]
MLAQKAQGEYANFETLVLFEGAALVALGLEVKSRYAQRHAGLAAVAVGAVGEQAAAAKALLDQLRIHIVLNRMAGRGHLRARHALAQVAAWVGCRCIELQGMQRKFVEPTHPYVPYVEMSFQIVGLCQPNRLLQTPSALQAAASALRRGPRIARGGFRLLP